MQYNSRFGWHLSAKGRKAGYRPIAFYKKDFITQGLFVNFSGLSWDCRRWVKLKLKCMLLPKITMLIITPLSWHKANTRCVWKIFIMVTYCGDTVWAVDLDNLVQVFCKSEEREIISGPGYAESVISFFVLFLFFFFFFKGNTGNNYVQNH